MELLIDLTDQASNSASWRGHNLMKWTTSNQGTSAMTECKECHRWIIVHTKPAPNEIDIGGPAIAVDCDKV